MSQVSNLVTSVVSFTKTCVGVRNKIVNPKHDKIMFIEILVSYLTAEDIFYSFPASKNAFRCYVLLKNERPT